MHATSHKHAASTQKWGDGLAIFVQLLPMILLLWVGIFLRWHNSGDSLPYFIDEIHHMRRSRVVWQFTELQTSLTPSKFGTYYWLGLFQLPRFPDLWLVRAPISIFFLLGASSAYALGKTLFNRHAGLLTALLATTWPFLLFYERLALTDPPTAAIVVTMAWWSVQVARKPSMQRANILALLVNLMIAFKFLAIPVLLVPFSAVIFFGKWPLKLNAPLLPQAQRIWQTYRPYIVRVAVVTTILWTAVVGIYVVRSIVTPDDVNSFVDEGLYTGGLAGDSGRFSTNINRTIEVFEYMWTPWLLILTAMSMLTLLWQRWRTLIFFTLAILPLWIFLILVAGKLATRYFTVVGYLCAVLISGGLVMFWQKMQKHQQQWLGLVPVVALLAWISIVALPFAWANNHDTESLPIPDRDKSEYFRAYTGFALPDAFDYIEQRGPITSGYEQPVIVAPIRICTFSIYHMTAQQRDDLNLVCQPYLEGENGDERFLRRYEWLHEEIAQYDMVYVMVEQYDNIDGPLNIDPARVQAEMTLLTTFERPHDGIPVEVYEVRAPNALAQTEESP